MGKRLAGTLFVYRGRDFDYCFIESIKALLECCDRVYVVAGGEDGTFEEVLDTIVSDKLELMSLWEDEWVLQSGKEKLAYFTNMAINMAAIDEYEYQLNIQADEIIHPDSYQTVRNAIETGNEAFFCTRINLWKDCNHQLNVEQSRKPCSTEIIRLAKTKYLSYGDAESLAVPTAGFDFMDDIKIIHYGFVRNRVIMKKKAVYIQDEVFRVTHDPKLDVSDEFIPEMWFNDDDLAPFSDHPKIMQEWVKTRP